MEQWKGKVALVTGASAGIGAQTVIDLAKAGVITIGMARRTERVEDLKKSVSTDVAKNIYSIKGDVSDEASVKSVFKWIKEKFGGVNILINNAGIIKPKMLLTLDESNEDYRNVMDTNLMGVVYCTREAYKQLKESDQPGYVININSVAGHAVPQNPALIPFMNVYPASKFGLLAITDVVRMELKHLENDKVRVTSISPGAVLTEIVGDLAANNSLSKYLRSEDISQAIAYVLSTPQHVEIKEIIIRPFGS